MTEELSHEPNDGRSRRKGEKEPRKESVKRTRSTKDKNGPAERGISSVRVQSGNDSAPASTTTTGRPPAETAPQAEAERSPMKSGAGSQLRKTESPETAANEVTASQNHERIARRAYALYEASGYKGEDALHHWLEAERELRNHKDDARES